MPRRRHVIHISRESRFFQEESDNSGKKRAGLPMQERSRIQAHGRRWLGEEIQRPLEIEVAVTVAEAVVSLSLSPCRLSPQESSRLEARRGQTPSFT